MMNKTIIISDLHLGQNAKTNISRCKKIIKYFNLLLEEISEYCRIHNYKPKLMILGDILHVTNLTPDIVEYIIKNVSFEQFEQIEIITGNHEIFIGQNGLESTLLPIFYNQNKFKHYLPGEWFLENKTLYLPYSLNLHDMVNFISNSKEIKNIDIMYGHFTSIELFEKEKISLLDLIKKKKIKKIFLGHLHLPKEVQINDCTIYSIGSTYYSNIAEVRNYTQNTKRFLVFDEETMEVESVPIKSLPKIIMNEVKEEIELEDIFKGDMEAIYYIKSSLPLDMTNYSSLGYDIYFDYITDDKLILLDKTLDIEKDDTIDINDCWKKYLGIQHMEKDVNEICDNIFNNRFQLNENLLYDMLLNNTQEVNA